jgi:hypothetical protein
LVFFGFSSLRCYFWPFNQVQTGNQREVTRESETSFEPNVWFVHKLHFLFVLAFFDSLLLSCRFWPFTDVLRKIVGSLTPEVWEFLKTTGLPAFAGQLRRAQPMKQARW